MKKLLLIALVLALLPFGCTTGKRLAEFPSRTILLPRDARGKLPPPYEVDGRKYYPLPDAYGFNQKGTASWYGKKFHGLPTASGEIYDMYKKTAAHKTLPLGTYVRVTNLSNNSSTIVRINDRGPFVKDRIIDLSYAAAKEIDMIRSGVAEVKIVALSQEAGKAEHNGVETPLVAIPDSGAGEFTIQVGAFAELENALTLAERLMVLFDYVEISPLGDGNGGTLHRVHVSKCKSRAEAERIKEKLEEMGFLEAFIIKI